MVSLPIGELLLQLLSGQQDSQCIDVNTSVPWWMLPAAGSPADLHPQALRVLTCQLDDASLVHAESHRTWT